MIERKDQLVPGLILTDPSHKVLLVLLSINDSPEVVACSSYGSDEVWDVAWFAVNKEGRLEGTDVRQCGFEELNGVEVAGNLIALTWVNHMVGITADKEKPE